MDKIKSSKIVLSYFQTGAICGRGGIIRFFLLAHGIPFEEDLFPMSEWPEKKKEILKITPFGHVPVVTIDDVKLFHTIPTINYICSAGGLSNDDPYKNFMQEAIADEVLDWRTSWVSVAFAPKEKAEEARTAYVANQPSRLASYEALYNKFITTADGVYAGDVASPLVGDICLFSQLYDDKKIGVIDDTILSLYPRLDALYKKIVSIPAIEAWITSMS